MGSYMHESSSTLFLQNLLRLGGVKAQFHFASESVELIIEN